MIPTELVAGYNALDTERQKELLALLEELREEQRAATRGEAATT